MRLIEAMRHKLRSFLKIENPQNNVITLNNLTDFETLSYINMVWSWGDKEAIEQLYKQLQTESKSQSFWSANPEMGIIKKHTGLPGIMVNTLTDIVVADMNDIKVDKRALEWEDMIKTLDIEELISDAVKDTLIIGDGAFKVSIDTNISEYPMVEFVSGENIEYTRVRGQITEVIFKTPVNHNHKQYVLEEVYGNGYIRTCLYDCDNQVPINTVPAYSNILPEIKFSSQFMMAVPLMFFKSPRHKGRGKSIYSGKADNFDSLDEIWSEWMDALRKGRTKEYIPENLLPRDVKTGETLKPNDFDHAFIKMEDSMKENDTSKITIIQPNIPHESYLSTYITALDLCLQGVISPSTLGIDTKKLDNAEAQREKEKTTLYTRNKIVSALQKAVPQLIDVMFKTYDTMKKGSVSDIIVDFSFGEYANPSFESQVETVSKAKSSAVMSTEAAVEELYGDSKDEEWKLQEVSRIKAEQGIISLEEPQINTEIEDFEIKESNVNSR
ncbi:MAG: capsid protein [Lachnospiraceae bacterium]|nr:capsid protein [Lachnospiraceae bacterium]